MNVQPQNDSELVPVFSRGVLSDCCVTDWEFYGFFKAPAMLQEWLEENISPTLDEYTYQTKNGRYQFKFVFKWSEEMLTQNHPPYSI